MKIDFNAIDEITVPRMNHGTETMTAKMYMGEAGKIIPCRIHPGGSIGMHEHKTSDDINYVLSGEGFAVCDGEKEKLESGVCHICKKGSNHRIVNTGDNDLVLLTIVVER